MMIPAIENIRKKISDKALLIQTRRNINKSKALVLAQRMFLIEGVKLYDTFEGHTPESIDAENSYIVLSDNNEINEALKNYIQDLISECRELNPTRVFTDEMIRGIIYIASLRCNFMLENKFLGD